MMTLEQVKEQYTVNRQGIITSLGKFEGSHWVDVALWDLALDSADETIYDGEMPVSVFVVDSELATLAPEYFEGVYAVALYESDQGFVYSSPYATKAELDAARARCEASDDDNTDSIVD